MLLSAVSVLVVAQSSSEIPEGLTNNPVHFPQCCTCIIGPIAVFSNTSKGDLQIARSYSSTSVIPRLYDRGYRHYLGLHFGGKSESTYP